MRAPLALPRAVRIGTIPAVLALFLTGCSSAASENPSGAPAPSASTAPDPVAPNTGSSAPAATSTAVVLELNGQQMTGELDDSATAASLIDLLPLTLPFRDYGGQEKVAELPTPLNLDGAPEGSEGQALSIGYYVPDQRLVLYYDDVSYYAGIVPIGKYDGAVSIQGLPDATPITIRAAD